MKTFAVYILSNASRMLYIGVTNDLDRRIWEHNNRVSPGYTARYGLDSLVYFEPFGSIKGAIAREKVLKGWLRSKKAALIAASNPDWIDLAATRFRTPRSPIRFPQQQPENSQAPTTPPWGGKARSPDITKPPQLNNPPTNPAQTSS
ncbi:MAG TPA: GIY-YIG nuclease family protein [Candidatus Acidoferrum sp.]|jgi:putative endonuclease